MALDDVEVLGVDDEPGELLGVHVSRRAERPDCDGCRWCSRWTSLRSAAGGLVWHKRRWIPPTLKHTHQTFTRTLE